MARTVTDEVIQPADPTPMDVDSVGEVAPAVPPAATAAATVGRQSMLAVMRDKYAKEKRVKVKVHSDGPVQVQVNGYSFLIRENVTVEVPESVAELLDQAGYI